MGWKRTLIGVAVTAAVFVSGSPAARPARAPAGAPAPENVWLTERRVANIAHAGGLHEAPQNTLFAFRTAAEREADVLEIDLQITADGHIVAMHDSTVDRTTDGQGCVVGHTLEEIQRLDAAHDHVDGRGPVAGLEPGAYPYRGVATGRAPAPAGFAAGDFTVPTLASIVEALPHAVLVVEIKPQEVERVGGVEHDCPAVLDAIPEAERPDIAGGLARLIEEHDLTDRVMVASFIDDLLHEFTALSPAVDTSFPLAEGLAFYDAFTRGTAPPNPHGHEAIQAPVEILGIRASAEFVAFAHEHGIAVHFWTINDPAEMAMLLDWGADGIITDRPQVFAEVRAEHEPPFVARYSAPQCAVLDHFVAVFGFDDVAAMIRNGVRGYAGVVDAGQAAPVEHRPANDGPCEIEVTWPADELAQVRRTAAAWGVGVDELHHLGGVILVVLVVLAASAPG